MSDISKRGPACEEGERGKRGRRGRDGATGPTGPGFAGSAGPTRQIFTADGTYVPTPGVTTVRVLMSGGGGGGGGSAGSIGNQSIGAGGGSGAALDFVLDGPITGGPVVIGAGGAGGIGGVSGSDGTASSVTINATVFTAAPGSGGGSGGPIAGTLATPGGGTLPGSTAVDVVSGDDGAPGIIAGVGNGVGGNGGSGSLGIGGAGGFLSTVDGSPGSGYGAGGGGSFSTTIDRNGGDGAPGVVIVDEYF